MASPRFGNSGCTCGIGPSRLDAHAPGASSLKAIQRSTLFVIAQNGEDQVTTMLRHERLNHGGVWQPPHFHKMMPGVACVSFSSSASASTALWCLIQRLASLASPVLIGDASQSLLRQSNSAWPLSSSGLVVDDITFFQKLHVELVFRDPLRIGDQDRRQFLCTMLT